MASFLEIIVIVIVIARAEKSAAIVDHTILRCEDLVLEDLEAAEGATLINTSSAELGAWGAAHVDHSIAAHRSTCWRARSCCSLWPLMERLRTMLLGDGALMTI